MVADALSRRPMSSLSHLRAVHLPQLIELRSLGVRLELTDSGSTNSKVERRSRVWATRGLSLREDGTVVMG